MYFQSLSKLYLLCILIADQMENGGLMLLPELGSCLNLGKAECFTVGMNWTNCESNTIYIVTSSLCWTYSPYVYSCQNEHVFYIHLINKCKLSFHFTLWCTNFSCYIIILMSARYSESSLIIFLVSLAATCLIIYFTDSFHHGSCRMLQSSTHYVSYFWLAVWTIMRL